jgi:CHAT domain-containing protein
MTVHPALLFLCLFLSSILQAQDDYKEFSKLSYDQIDSLTYIEYQKGTFNRAIFYLKAGQLKAKEEFGEEHARYGEATANLAFFYQRAGQYELALSASFQALKTLAIAYGKDHDRYSIALENLASLYRVLGNYDQALNYYTQAKDIVLNKEQDHPHKARILNNMALIYRETGHNELALSLFIQVKDFFKSKGATDKSSYATILNNIALVYKNLGKEEEALTILLQAKDIYGKYLGKRHPTYAVALSNISGTYKTLGNLDQALTYELEARAIQLQIYGNKHPAYAKSLHAVADLNLTIDNYLEAEKQYKEAIRIYEQAFGNQHPSYALALNKMVDCHIQMGNYELAWEELHQVMRNMSNLQLTDSFDENWNNKLKGVTYPSNAHIEQMLTALSQSYQLLGKDSSILNPQNKQEFVADLALALLQKVRNQISTEQDKLRILTRSNNWLEGSLGILNPKDDKQKAFQLSDQHKSVLLFQATQSETAFRLGNLPDSLVWQNKQLLKKQGELQAKLYEKGNKDSLRILLNEVNQNIDLWQKKVKKDYPKYYELQYTQTDVRADELQKLLDEQTALIEYVITDSVLHIFKLTTKALIWHQETLSDSILLLKISEYHKILSSYQAALNHTTDTYQNYTSLSHWMYRKLLQPVLDSDTEIENLIIVTDAELGHLPFESFLVEPATNESFSKLHYLLKDYAISYNYSATLWQKNKQERKRQHNGQLLAMAANYQRLESEEDLIKRSPTVQRLRQVLQPLPAARAEVEALEQRYQGFFAFDSLASEKILTTQVEDFAIIHLAMHGLLDEKRPMLSSLALTENGDSLNDNFWQAYEISKMELNADLVVLSACETGYGRFETGNGIASLARAFMYAGVPSLVVSLWQVNDVSTSIIMQNFYKHLASGMTKSAALRQAKLDYIESVDNPIAAHPAFWSPFILIGDESPVQLQRKGAGNWLWWAVGGGALLLGGVALGLRKGKKAA